MRSYLGTMLLEKPDRTKGVKSERVLRVLLSHPDGEYTRYRIAKEADVTESWCRTLLDRFEDRGLVEDTVVQDARGLFNEWLDIRVEPRTVTVAFQNPLDTIASAGLEYALTTSYAENRYQGLLFESTVDLYIQPRDGEAWVEFIRNDGLLGGGNTRIRVSDEHVFYEAQELDGQPVVSPAQLIVDLLAEDGPAVQAAEDLIERRYR
jgi:hypothetical protein